MGKLIIDAHSHLWLKQNTTVDGKRILSLKNGRSIFMDEEVQMLPPFMIDGQNTAEVFLSNMNYAQVGAAVVVQEVIDGNQNDYLADVQQRYPDRFFCMGMAWNVDEAQRVIEKYLIEYGKGDNEMLANIVLSRWPERHNLQRFLAIQQGGNDPNVDHTSFHRAMTEIRSGSKRTRWVNYFFPQMKTDRDLPTFYYSLRDETEALIYINHPMLRKRLLKMCEAILQNDHSIFDIFSRFDIKMIRSCIDLFSQISSIKIFEQMRQEYGWKYYADKF